VKTEIRDLVARVTVVNWRKTEIEVNGLTEITYLVILMRVTDVAIYIPLHRFYFTSAWFPLHLISFLQYFSLLVVQLIELD